MKKFLLALSLFVQICFGSAHAQAQTVYSDLWWNPSESGWGIVLNHQSDIIFAAWYTYGTDGKAIWTVTETRRQANGTYTGPIYQTTGVPVGAINGQQSMLSVSSVGSATFTFSAANTGTFAYTLGAVNQSKAITRQQYTTSATTCTMQAGTISRAASQNYQDLWWVPAESGWGINLTHQSDVIFAAWFTYATGGAPQWVVGSRLERQADGSYTGTLNRTTGTPLAQINGQTASQSVTAVGTITLRFADGERGTMTTTLDGVSGTKNIVRQVFGNTVNVCTNPASTISGGTPTPPAAGGSCRNYSSLTTGNTYDYRITLVQPGKADTIAYQRETVIGPASFQDTPVTIVEIRTITATGGAVNEGYSRVLYEDRGATIGAVAGEGFDAAGAKTLTTTYAPIDFFPKFATIGASYGGAFKATSVGSAGGFTTNAVTDYSYELKVTGNERVTVPAGSFDTCRSELTRFTANVSFAITGFPVGGFASTCSGIGSANGASIGVVRSVNDSNTCTGTTADGAAAIYKTTRELVRASVDGRSYP